MNYRLFVLVSMALLIGVMSVWIQLTQTADAFTYAKAQGKKLVNAEATVPLACYTNTEAQYNPCWACHTISHSNNFQSDVGLQSQYNFSEAAKTNFWSNAFLDVTEQIKSISDENILNYIRQDNYQNLLSSLKNENEKILWRPDLNFSAGFDDKGFAKDNSGWRALRFKPFVGTFWPTNGNSNDVYIRLPQAFREDTNHQFNAQIYQDNLTILEAAMTTPPQSEAQKQLPTHYLGGASTIPVVPHLYPQGTEFLHTVRYLDPDVPSFTAKRMKEVRYSKKIWFLEPWAILKMYEQELAEKDEGRKPLFAGNAFDGLYNNLGWLYQGYIEDARGQLRLQSYEEQMSCMGCHANLGVTVDSSFAFVRKVPGDAGWQIQNVHGIPDAPLWNHQEAEISEYLKRSGALDEFRTNIPKTEPHNITNTKTLADWILPTKERALQMNKAYQILVQMQNFERGRQVFLQPPTTILKNVTTDSTGLAESNKVYFDGHLWLDW